MERLQWWLLLLSAVMFSMSGCSSTRAWQGTALSDFEIWKQHSTHFASARHLVFSSKSHPTTASITEADKATAGREAWWGHLVPQEKMAVVAKPKPAKPTPVVASSDESPARPVAQAKESWWRRVLPGSGKKTPRTVDGVALAPAASAPAPMPTDRKDISGVWRGRWAANGSWGERRESDAQMIFAQLGTKGTARMVLTDTVAATGPLARLVMLKVELAMLTGSLNAMAIGDPRATLVAPFTGDVVETTGATGGNASRPAVIFTSSARQLAVPAPGLPTPP